MLVASKVVARLPRASLPVDGKTDGGETQPLDTVDVDCGDTMILLSRHTENASSPLSRLDGTNPSDEGLITGWGIGCNLGDVEYIVVISSGLAE